MEMTLEEFDQILLDHVGFTVETYIKSKTLTLSNATLCVQDESASELEKELSDLFRPILSVMVCVDRHTPMTVTAGKVRLTLHLLN